MEDEPNNSMGETSSRSLSNNITTRSVERTTTQKLPIPILEKNDHTSAKLWRRKFTQYIKMTRELGLSKMTKFQRGIATIQGPTRRGNKRRLYLGNRTVSINRNDEDGKRKRTNIFTIVPSIRTV